MASAQDQRREGLVRYPFGEKEQSACRFPTAAVDGRGTSGNQAGLSMYDSVSRLRRHEG
jgi:hypothetical protein